MENQNRLNFSVEYFPIALILILTYILRFVVDDPKLFTGNILSIFIFILICVTLAYFLLFDKPELYLMSWLSFYFASPIIKLPFLKIGSFGIFLGIFLPLMILKFFDKNDLKNKYFLAFSLLTIYSFLNLSKIDFRTILSDYIEIETPLLFFYYTKKKVKETDKIMNYSIFVALIYLPLVIYEIAAKPSWGGLSDWRGYRIFGNLFWHNSYAFYLLPMILIAYAKLRKKISEKQSQETIKQIAVLSTLMLMFFFTFSRNGFLTLFLSLLFFEAVLNSGLKINPKKIAILGLSIFFILIYFLLADQLGNRFKLDTIDERTAIWESLIPLIGENPVFGYGLGSYEIYREQVIRSLSSHNYYLFLLFTLGLTGLIFVLYFIYLIIVQLNGKIQKETELINIKRKNFNGEIGLSILFGILVYSLFGNSAFTHVVSLNAWILLGVCVNEN